MTLAADFAAQIRGAFMQSYPIPVFSTRAKRISGMKGFKTAQVPSIAKPIPSLKQMQDLKFQAEVNQLLRDNPVRLTGKESVTMDNRLTIDIGWSVRIHHIDAMAMDKNGVIGILKYKFSPTLRF